MSREIHSVVKDADYVDEVPMPRPVHNNMPPPTTAPRYMQRAHSGPQIVADNGSENFRAGVEIGKSGKDCRFVDGCLTRAENVAGIAENTNEIFFRLRAEDDAPRFFSHDGSGAAARAFAPTVLR